MKPFNFPARRLMRKFAVENRAKGLPSAALTDVQQTAIKQALTERSKKSREGRAGMRGLL
jgi:hypothetical protein